MGQQLNLSPLAFEILKFLCNNPDPNEYQTLSKDTLNVEDQNIFDQAITELQGKNLIESSVISQEDEVSEDYTKYITSEANSNTHQTKVISARISSNAGDICGEMDYYIEAQRDTDV